MTKEEAAIEYCNICTWSTIKSAFIAGAKWQKEQDKWHPMSELGKSNEKVIVARYDNTYHILSYSCEHKMWMNYSPEIYDEFKIIK